MYKVIVTGTSAFTDYSLLERGLIHFFFRKKPADVEIVIAETSRSIEQLAEQFVKEKGCSLKKFSESTSSIEMIKYADACIVFGDRDSIETENIKELAQNEGLDVVIWDY